MVSQYNGSGDFDEWIKKLELVAKIQNIKKKENFVPLFLTGGAFAVYDALPEKKKDDYDEIRAALSRAFSIDRFRAFEEFSHRRLQPGESVDVYLSDLRTLGYKVSGDLSDDWLVCAFVAGLPYDISTNLKSACKLEAMSLNDVVERTRIVMSLRQNDACAAANAYKSGKQAVRSVRCYGCGVEGHTKRFCPKVKRREGYEGLQCYRCGLYGHISKFCSTAESKNAGGNLQSAPVGSPLEGRNYQ
ncbi:MAG: hypothetical protein AAGJ57_08955 [Pseudomonadota bacterium]